MISGSVLLGKQENYRVVFKKRILKIIIVIVLFSFIYYVNNIITYSKSFSVLEFFTTIIQKPITNAYWYLYMYLGLLVMLPILRKTVQNMQMKDYLYCFIIWTIFIGLMPIINYYFALKSISTYFSLPMFTGYIIYFFMGYFIENKLEHKFFNKKIAVVLVILSILCIGVSVATTYYDKYILNNNSLKIFMDNNAFITIAIPSITLFYLCKYIVLKKENAISGKVITNISTCTLGIYLLSDLLIDKLDFVYEYLGNYMHKLYAIVILEVLVFSVGYVITAILKRIPFIKKLI